MAAAGWRCGGCSGQRLAAEHRLGDVVAPGVVGVDVAQRGVDRLVAPLAHDVDEGQLQVAGLGEQAAPQRVAGEPVQIEAGVSVTPQNSDRASGSPGGGQGGRAGRGEIRRKPIQASEAAIGQKAGS